MKILFTSTYYNNPAFIEFQLKSLKLFLQHEFDFLVMDDSAADTVSLVNGGLATKEIEEECKRLGVKYHRVPQWIHANKNKGGLVPNGLPAGHPTERHRACLHWILQNNDQLGWNNYQYVMLAESDMLLRKPVTVEHIMSFGALSFAGTGRKKYQVNRTSKNQPDWPAEYANSDQVVVDFFTMYLTVFNMKHSLQHILTNMNIAGFGGTDTGGCTSIMLQGLTYDVDYRFIEISGNTNYQVDFFYYNAVFGLHRPQDVFSEDKAQFVHYRGGSNWDYQTMDYYWEKFYRMLRKYVPELYDAEKAKHTSQNLTSRDKEHTFFVDEE